MGLFSKAKREYRKPSEKEILDSLADFNDKQGNWKMAFKFRNKGVIDLYDQEIGKCIAAAYNANDDAQALKFYFDAKNQYDSFRSWCLSMPDGERFFEEFDHTGPDRVSRYQRICDSISHYEERIRAANEIKQKAKDGVLQSDLIKCFDLDPSEVRMIVNKLEEKGSVIKEKSGKSYVIKTK